MPELLTAAAIADLPVHTKTHRLNPRAVRRAQALGAATGLTQLGLHLMRVAPGHRSTEYHFHHYEEQAFYILSGRGEALIDGARRPIGPGDFLGFARCGAAHTLINTGDEDLVFLAARTQLEQDVCDYPMLGKRLYMNGEEEMLVDLDQVRCA